MTTRNGGASREAPRLRAVKRDNRRQEPAESETAMKTYSNRFAEMEQQPCGGWIVWSKVAGLPLDENGELCDDCINPGFGRLSMKQPKIHRDYASARETMLVLTAKYKRL